MKITVVHILLLLIVNLVKNFILELTKLLHVLLITILKGLTINLNEIVHPVKNSELKLTKPGEFRSDQPEGIVPGLNVGDPPESG